MKNKKLAFVDLETTGINPALHEIIEIGCLIARPNESGGYDVLDEFEIKVKPEHIETAEQAALRMNGYDESAWVLAHSQVEGLQMLSQKCRDCVLVGQNISFDYAFLAHAFGTYGVEDPFFYAKLDTISMAFLKFRDEEDTDKFTLRALCDRFNIKNDRAHTALADIRATYQVFLKLLQK
jgi:DNA polymerase III alpha subunit (gram-positive type)